MIDDNERAFLGIVPGGHDSCGAPLFRLGPKPDAVQMFEHPKGRLLVGDRDGWLVWALLEWVQGGPIPCPNFPETPAEYAILAHGEGTGDPLREARHTWFGREGDGYVFYLHGDLLTWAIGELRRWFDLD